MTLSSPLTAEGVLKLISSKLPSNIALKAGSEKQQRLCKDSYYQRIKLQDINSLLIRTAGGEDDWPLGSAHERLDSSKES